MPELTWTPEDADFNHAKQKLIEYYYLMNYTGSQLCLNAFERIARSIFVTEEQRSYSYNDSPLPIGHGQTISAPHMAFMQCNALEISPGDHVLEIGSGSGYHATVVAEMCAPSNTVPAGWKPLTRYYDDTIYEEITVPPGRVVTMERLNPLVDFARENTHKAGYADRITILHGDGTIGYEAEAPYDKILVTAAGPSVPKTLKRQLKPGGRLIIPVGTKNFHQNLVLVTRVSENKWTEYNVGGVVFVPLIGKYGFDS